MATTTQPSQMPKLKAYLRDLQRHPAHLHALKDHGPWLQQREGRSAFRDLRRVEAGRMRMPVPAEANRE